MERDHRRTTGLGSAGVTRGRLSPSHHEGAARVARQSFVLKGGGGGGVVVVVTAGSVVVIGDGDGVGDGDGDGDGDGVGAGDAATGAVAGTGSDACVVVGFGDETQATRRVDRTTNDGIRVIGHPTRRPCGGVSGLCKAATCPLLWLWHATVLADLGSRFPIQRVAGVVGIRDQQRGAGFIVPDLVVQ